jgi:hypothetical protein
VAAQRSGSRGVKLFEADVLLAGYVGAGEIPTIAGVKHMDGPNLWDGWLDGLTKHQRGELFGKELELRLENGPITKVVLNRY